MKIPKSAQNTIPIQCVYRDNIWRVGRRYSKTWLLQDTNYAVASAEKKDWMREALGAEIYNTLPSDCYAKITINDRRINPREFKKSTLMPLSKDSLDPFRREYNQMLMDKVEASNGIVQEKYLTISVERNSITEARTFFNNMNTLPASFQRLSSDAITLDNEARLRIIHDFFRTGEEAMFNIDLQDLMSRGHDFKDAICPDTIQFKGNHFRFGEKYGRVLFLKEFPTQLTDSMISDMSVATNNQLLSIDIVPISTDEVVKKLSRIILGIESDKAKFQNNQNKHMNWLANVPYELQQMSQAALGLMDDVTLHNQRMFMVLVTLVHIADSLEQLNVDTDNYISLGRKASCEFSILRQQQEAGLNTVLPYGLREIKNMRSLTTKATSGLVPFRCQEISHEGGIYYGVNAISGNLIICDRRQLQNGNGFIFGVSGSGKSFAAKNEIINLALRTDDDIIIVDPEAEYFPLIDKLGGETIKIAAGSPHHINAMDISLEYGDGENPIALKAEFILSLCEQILGAGKMESFDRSIVDRCTDIVYRDYIKDFEGKPPTLIDLRRVLLEQPEDEARKIALAMEIFAEGSMNVFAQQTNVDTQNRITVYDLHDMGEQLKPIALLVMLDAIQNRVLRNSASGKRTWVFIDEIYLFFLYKYSGEYLHKCWKRYRKLNACLTGITQNIEECLLSETARMMLANSEFLIMLNQAATDRAELQRILGISDEQLDFVTNASAGNGLLRVGGALVPFVNVFPRNELYGLMSTRPGDNFR